jgi:ABC-type transporter Mla MlaB component
MLRITVVENPEGEKWILQGQLTGEFATELSTTWRSSLDRSRDRLRIVDLSEVTSIDRNGEEILRNMIRQGARCVATGIYTRHLLEELQVRTKREKEDL